MRSSVGPQAVIITNDGAGNTFGYTPLRSYPCFEYHSRISLLEYSSYVFSCSGSSSNLRERKRRDFSYIFLITH